MPIYIFKHPDKEEYVEVLQQMNDDHTFSEDEVQWIRQFTLPQVSMNGSGRADPYSKQQFMNRSDNKNYTLGNLADINKELSDKRADRDGKDPIKEKYLKQYKKDTGREHASVKRVAENKNVKIEL